jgi:ABC-type sugar transport system permease subunit
MKIKKDEVGWLLLFIAPTLILFTLFFILPILFLLASSFTTPPKRSPFTPRSPVSQA